MTAPLAASAGVPEARQQLRDLTLDGNAQVHAVQVVGWPNVTTAIRFNDSFEAANVLCGQCSEVAPGEAEGAKRQDDKRNWIIEKRPTEQSIHVRPAVIPGIDDNGEKITHSDFTTNIYMGLNGGHSVNIELKLLHPSLLPPGAPLTADAVVTLRLPEGATLTGKLKEEREKLLASQEAAVTAKAHKLMLERLAGRVKCRDIHWRRPHRTDKAVLQLNQLCSSAGPRKTFWVTFELENRSDRIFYVEGAALVPEAKATVLDDLQVTPAFDKTTLAFGETAQGLALATLDEGSDPPRSWRLVVSPASPDRAEVTADHLTF
ncbi:MAG TPA: hypothetical protein VFH51_00625 [Myxococcota bacterium]|nr:hypothetical protein [Myxococcota bacterium]